MGLLGDLIGSYLRDDIGKYGESLTEWKLEWAKIFGRKGVTLKNLYLPTEDGGTSEIDLVYITKKGIFVIESKNYSGWIFGDEYSQYWTQCLPNHERNRFYNPIKQNRTHIKWLKSYLGEEVFCYSMIVFSERCELKKVTTRSENISVIHRDELNGELRYLWKRMEDSLDETKIEEIRQKLEVLTDVDADTKQAHIDSIQSRFQNPVSSMQSEVTVAETETEIDELNPSESDVPLSEDQQLICPRCGAALVLRTAKKGANAGNQFYGCSAFPKCRYIRQIEPTDSNPTFTEEQ